MHTPTLNHYFEPKIMRIIIEIIRYTGKMCHNSIMGDHINFILGG